MTALHSIRKNPRIRYPKTLPEQDKVRPSVDPVHVVEREERGDEYQKREMVEE